MSDIQLGTIVSNQQSEMGLVPNCTIHVCPSNPLVRIDANEDDAVIR